MIALLIRLYPARWQARFGDEFAALLEERPLGPFDVADVLLGALDAHLHLRGLGAASQHERGFAMSLRIGAYAGILGGVLWFIGLAASSASPDNNELWAVLLLLATVLLLVALVGLSAFQARRNPRLVWAAFTVPAVGAAVAVVGMIGMAANGDARFIGELSAWYVWALGTMGLIVGSALFALATMRTQSLSRVAAALLGVGALAILPALAGLGGGVLVAPAMLAFTGGWVALGVSAIRIDGPRPVSIEGVA